MAESAMHSPEVRLECLRLANRPGLSPAETIQAARVYLEWVAGFPTTPEGPGDRAKALKPTAPNNRTSSPQS